MLESLPAEADQKPTFGTPHDHRAVAKEKEPKLIAVEVSLNDKLLAVAGAKDLSVLSAIVSASGKLGPDSHGTKSRKGGE